MAEKDELEEMAEDIKESEFYSKKIRKEEEAERKEIAAVKRIHPQQAQKMSEDIETVRDVEPYEIAEDTTEFERQRKAREGEENVDYAVSEAGDTESALDHLERTKAGIEKAKAETTDPEKKAMLEKSEEGIDKKIEKITKKTVTEGSKVVEGIRRDIREEPMRRQQAIHAERQKIQMLPKTKSITVAPVIQYPMI